MEPKDLIEVFDRQEPCEYRGRNYLVRDNGSILRLPIDKEHPTRLDNIWTFGKKRDTGYMAFTGNIMAHQIVCTAYHGPSPHPDMVVDHIDTNRCNNRPENLRWVTRLENVLNNPATRKKIIFHCGSIEAFIANPSMLNKMDLPHDISWMRPVAKEAAEICRRNIERWAKVDSSPVSNKTGKSIGDYVFSDEEMETVRAWNGGQLLPPQKTYAQQKAEIEAESLRQYERDYGLKDSLTPGAKQLNWKTPTEFPLCPGESGDRSFAAYLDNLKKGGVFTRTEYSDGGVVLDYGFNPTDNAIYVLTYKEEAKDDPVGKPWALCKITLQGRFFVHENEGSFFHEDGGKKYFTLAMNREWTGGEVYDDQT